MHDLHKIFRILELHEEVTPLTCVILKVRVKDLDEAASLSVDKSLVPGLRLNDFESLYLTERLSH